MVANSSQPPLPFSAIRNSELFSNHWLENRLPLEPEWHDVRAKVRQVLDALAAIWKVQRTRVEHYGVEQALEQGFIQPVLQALGWKLIYQTFLRGRKPDYALFLDDRGLDAALATGRQTWEFWNHPTLVADAKAWHVSLERPTIVNQQREYPPEQNPQTRRSAASPAERLYEKSTSSSCPAALRPRTHSGRGLHRRRLTPRTTA